MSLCCCVEFVVLIGVFIARDYSGDMRLFSREPDFVSRLSAIVCMPAKEKKSEAPEHR